MTKKSFAAAPKPTKISDAQISAFEQGGAGHDSPQAKRQVTPSVTLKRLSVDIPANLHTRFKTACSSTGSKMVDELVQMIEARTIELEK